MVISIHTGLPQTANDLPNIPVNDLRERLHYVALGLNILANGKFSGGPAVSEALMPLYRGAQAARAFTKWQSANEVPSLD